MEATITEFDVALTVDARGQSCPGPLVLLAKGLKGLPAGSLVELLATDPGSVNDIPSWAELSGNLVLHSGDAGNGSYRYVVKKV